MSFFGGYLSDTVLIELSEYVLQYSSYSDRHCTTSKFFRIMIITMGICGDFSGRSGLLKTCSLYLIVNLSVLVVSLVKISQGTQFHYIPR